MRFLMLPNDDGADDDDDDDSAMWKSQPAMERIKETTKNSSTTREIKSEKQRGETAVENVNERVAVPAQPETSKEETMTRRQHRNPRQRKQRREGGRGRGRKKGTGRSRKKTEEKK